MLRHPGAPARDGKCVLGNSIGPFRGPRKGKVPAGVQERSMGNTSFKAERFPEPMERESGFRGNDSSGPSGAKKEKRTWTLSSLFSPGVEEGGVKTGDVTTMTRDAFPPRIRGFIFFSGSLALSFLRFGRGLRSSGPALVAFGQGVDGEHRGEKEDGEAGDGDGKDFRVNHEAVDRVGV